MREQGATDYAVFALRLPGGVMSAVSIATDAPDGFEDSQIGAFRTLVPLLALIVESKETARMARALLEVYLGKDAGDAVLKGQVRRGDARTIAAAIWFCDLRDFTRLSNAMPNEAVIAMLNDFFDTMAKPVIARGGEILKFIGDAMLAIFPMKDDLDRDCQCRMALDAALEALEGLKALNVRRSEKGQMPLKAGIGLHAGSVSYGNIGAIQDDLARLDFTVIGPAVNLAARLEGLCPLLDEPLVASAGFASTCGSNLAPLGRHQLHGFDEPQDVFGLPR
jgi:adenylate cyclase